jgi:hypothetical protein
VFTIDNNAVTTSKIADGNVTLAKLANQNDDTFLANISGSSGPPSAVALTTLAGAGLTGGADAILAVGAGTGITVNANDVAVTIPLTDGDKGDITVATSGTVWTVDNSAITLAKMENRAAGTVIGRAIDAGTGAPTALTGAQVGSLTRRYWWETTDTTSSGNINGYTLTDKQIQIHFNLASPATIRSFTVNDGKMLEIALESTSAALTLVNEHASGTLGLIRTPGAADLVLGPGDGCILTYFNSRYRVTGVSRRGVADRDYGDITVTSAGLTWTIDNNAVSLAKLATIAQSRIIGGAEGAGTATPTALTPTQVVAIIDGESPTWTGAHTFTGAGLISELTDDLRLGTSSAGGIGLFSGQSTTVVGNGDIVLNATSGIVVNAGGSVVNTVADGTLDINATTIDIDATGNVTLDTPGNITVAASSTGTTTVTGGSGGLILTATGTIDLNSPHRLNNTTRFTAILSSTLAGDVDDLDVGTANVVRLSPNAGARRLRGMAAGGDGQLVLLLNTSTTLSFNIIDESDTVDGTSSAAANRFRLPGTTTQSLGPNGGVWMWKDATTNRWRMI